jgi:undecaprenyl phosphate-alpha-L-ara4FN deformylase
VDGKILSQPQIPVTLPTYDEVIGQRGISDDNYNEYMLSLLDEDKLNVLAIHAEVEGIARRVMFERFVALAESRDVSFVPLGTFLDGSGVIGRGTLIAEEIPGRHGWASRQDPLPPVKEIGAK